MTTPNIDTFEYDIANEIKSKEASIGDIASATGDVGNAPEKPNSVFLPILVSLLFIIIAGGILYFGYSYYEKKMTPVQSKTPIEIPKTNDTSLLSSLSASFPDSFGRFVSNVEKMEYGYNITITSYSPVFAYMLKNENIYADDIARAVGSPRDMSTTTPSFSFRDVTINNQNMRIGVSASSTVVYAFINTENLLIASSTDGILSLRSAIIR